MAERDGTTGATDFIPRLVAAHFIATIPLEQAQVARLFAVSDEQHKEKQWEW